VRSSHSCTAAVAALLDILQTKIICNKNIVKVIMLAPFKVKCGSLFSRQFIYIVLIHEMGFSELFLEAKMLSKFLAFV